MLDVQLIGSWYKSNDRGFTTIEKDKLPYSVLDILVNDRLVRTGIANKATINAKVAQSRPDLKTDDWGNLISLDSLLKSFDEGGLIKIEYINRDTRIKITPLGIQFFNENVI